MLNADQCRVPSVAVRLMLLILLLPAGLQPALGQTPPDITGVYRAGRASPPCGFEDFERSADCPITEAALERAATVTYYDDPGLRCEADALSRLLTRLPRPMEILRDGDDYVFHYEYFGIRRVIHMAEGARPPAGLEPALHGYSTGRWEGDTLVVETTGLTENLFTLPNSGELRIVERYTPNADGTITLNATIDDPVFYTRPYDLGTATFRPTPDDFIAEWTCTPQDGLFTDEDFDLDSFFDD